MKIRYKGTINAASDKDYASLKGIDFDKAKAVLTKDGYKEHEYGDKDDNNGYAVYRKGDKEVELTYEWIKGKRNGEAHAGKVLDVYVDDNINGACGDKRSVKAAYDNEDIVMYWDGQKVYEGPVDSNMTREIVWFLDDPEKLQEIVDYCNSFGDPVIEDTSNLMDVAATFVEMVDYELKEANSIDDDVYVSDEAGHFEIFEKSKEVTGAEKSVKCSTDGKVPYDLVSMLVALRDYADVSDAYVNDEHGKLVDIADSLYNVGRDVIDKMKPEFKKVYEKYGSDYFDKVLDDVSALDSQLTRNNVNDLIADYEDRANNFNGVEGACGGKKSVKAAQEEQYDITFKSKGTTYYIQIIEDGGNYVAKWWDSSDNGLGYNNKGWVALNNDFGRNTGKFNSENIESLLSIISEYDRKPRKPVQDRIKREVAKLIDFDTINSSVKVPIKSSDFEFVYDEDDEDYDDGDLSGYYSYDDLTPEQQDYAVAHWSDFSKCANTIYDWFNDDAMDWYHEDIDRIAEEYSEKYGFNINTDKMYWQSGSQGPYPDHWRNSEVFDKMYLGSAGNLTDVDLSFEGALTVEVYGDYYIGDQVAYGYSPSQLADNGANEQAVQIITNIAQGAQDFVDEAWKLIESTCSSYPDDEYVRGIFEGNPTAFTFIVDENGDIEDIA